MMLYGLLPAPLCSLYYLFNSSITDVEAVSMSRWLVKHDGLFLGSSSACNLVAAVRVAKILGRHSKKTIVTILWVVDSYSGAKYRPPAGVILALDTIPR